MKTIAIALALVLSPFAIADDATVNGKIVTVPAPSKADLDLRASLTASARSIIAADADATKAALAVLKDAAASDPKWQAVLTLFQKLAKQQP